MKDAKNILSSADINIDLPTKIRSRKEQKSEEIGQES